MLRPTTPAYFDAGTSGLTQPRSRKCSIVAANAAANRSPPSGHSGAVDPTGVNTRSRSCSAPFRSYRTVAADRCRRRAQPTSCSWCSSTDPCLAFRRCCVWPWLKYPQGVRHRSRPREVLAIRATAAEPTLYSSGRATRPPSIIVRDRDHLLAAARRLRWRLRRGGLTLGRLHNCRV